jgi:hypothetical protein
MTHEPWEYFEDMAYFNMWCVRKKDDTSFDSPTSFHVINYIEARKLCDYLNGQYREQVAREQIFNSFKVTHGD